MGTADIERLEEAVRRYDESWPTYKNLAETVERELNGLVADMPSRPWVSSRPKTLLSFAGKIRRGGGKYTRPLEDLMDLAGARVVAMSQSDVDEICRRIERHAAFEIDWPHSGDTLSRLRAMEFGYRGRHYVIRLNASVLRRGAFSRALLGRPVEIQVKTHLQHVWAEIEHDRGYKTGLKLPAAVRRELGRIAAILERADASFQELLDRLDRFADEPEGMPEAVREQILVHEVVLNARTAGLDPDHLAQHLGQLDGDLLQLARLQRAAGQPEQSYQTLQRLHRAEPEHELERARSALEAGRTDAARRHLGACAVSGARSLSKKQNVARLLSLAELDIDADPRAAFDALRDAARAAPEEPEVVVRLAEAALVLRRDPETLDLMQGSVGGALRECELRLSLGVHVARTRFAQARLELYRDCAAPWEGMSAYARAACDVTGCGLLERELAGIRRIREALSGAAPAPLHRGPLRGLAWTEAFLNVVSVARARSLLANTAANPTDPDSARLGAIAARSLPRCASSTTQGVRPQILVVAGGCGGFPETRRHTYTHLLRETLRDFDGLVVGGGTTAGICGILGDVLPAVAPQARLLGYVPQVLPHGEALHPAYGECVKVDDEGFTPLGPLQTWADLLEAGVLPQQVRVLGINGGLLAGFEYQLALACGGTVALMSGSGREADRLLAHPFWERRYGLAPIPHDAAVARAFVHADGPHLAAHDVARRNWIEAAAEAAHEHYRLSATEHGDVPPGLRYWKDLPEVFRASSRHMVAYAGVALRSVGFDLVALDPANPKRVTEFTQKELEQLACHEHGRYVAERLSNGWRRGEVNDIMARTNPTLVPWADLDARDRDKDRACVRLYPRFFEAANLMIVRGAADPSSGESHG